MNWSAPKRFWTDVHVREVDGGFAVLLDERSVKTPAKAALVLPHEGLAQGVAREWAAVEEVIDPHTMRLTRAANAAIDKVSLQRAEVADMLAA